MKHFVFLLPIFFFLSSCMTMKEKSTFDAVYYGVPTDSSFFFDSVKITFDLEKKLPRWHYTQNRKKIKDSAKIEIKANNQEIKNQIKQAKNKNGFWRLLSLVLLTILVGHLLIRKIF